MIHLVVCTHGRRGLTLGAIASVMRHATDAIRVTVLDSSHTLDSWDAITVLHVDCPAYYHAAAARKISLDGELAVCIDDDMRLVARATLQERYTAGWYKHLNGHMLQAWTGPNVTTPYTRLTQWRMSRRCDNLPAVLCEYAAATNAEQIDTVWIHIDKGSQPPTPEREALTRYIDHGPGLGDVVSAGLSAIGITKERVSKTLGVKDCGCKKRQQQLNELGRRLGIG
jgi:hypothetical protein